ncbi:hypothetical protein [Streptomyces sp. NPDC090025]|uniref:hypothetical protein n=1 Tax=Streptomyces sp. NPDC090025 TaxID=3365922 RepID=UPI0038388F8A
MAEYSDRPKHCTYCPNPGADCCVRVHPDGQHIYAHRICATVRGVPYRYVFVDGLVRIGAGR